jgi:hypothetical protein
MQQFEWTSRKLWVKRKLVANTHTHTSWSKPGEIWMMLVNYYHQYQHSGYDIILVWTMLALWEFEESVQGDKQTIVPYKT